jgi:acyl-CoA synthetase (NDP forming)
LLGTQPLPAGKRVAIVTNFGGPGTLCADAVAAHGLELPALNGALQTKLRSILRGGASTRNPVDMRATAGATHYRRVLGAIADDGSVDAVIAIYTPTGLDEPLKVMDGMGAAVDAVGGKIPVLLVALTRDASRGLIEGRHGSAPVYPFPDDAARALGHAVRRHEWLRRPLGEVVDFADLRPERAAAVIAASLADGGGWLGPGEIAELLGAYGLESLESRVVASPAEAAEAAESIGFPIALKADAAGIVHKSEAGAVALHLATRAEVASAAQEMAAKLGERGHPIVRFVVQRMVTNGIEMLVGVASDQTFGPVVVCGAGGATAELRRDIGARITPLTDVDAGELVERLRISPLLQGWRGSPPTDVAALEETLLRVSALVEAHAEVRELDLDPVVVNSDGAWIVDARVRIAGAPSRSSWPAVGVAGPSLLGRRARRPGARLDPGRQRLQSGSSARAAS